MYSSDESIISVSETDERAPLTTATVMSKRKFSMLFRQDTNDMIDDFNLDNSDELNDEMSLKFLLSLL